MQSLDCGPLFRRQDFLKLLPEDVVIFSDALSILCDQTFDGGPLSVAQIHFFQRLHQAISSAVPLAQAASLVTRFAPLLSLFRIQHGQDFLHQGVALDPTLGPGFWTRTQLFNARTMRFDQRFDLEALFGTQLECLAHLLQLPTGVCDGWQSQQAGAQQAQTDNRGSENA